jgi:hypothetical protein
MNRGTLRDYHLWGFPTLIKFQILKIGELKITGIGVSTTLQVKETPLMRG